MNFEVRRRVDEKGPDEEEFNKLTHSLDEFTSSLLNPLKSNTENRQIFADSLGDVMENAIELEQKKVKKPVGSVCNPCTHTHIPILHLGTRGSVKTPSPGPYQRRAMI